jgi:hypothetical protein
MTVARATADGKQALSEVWETLSPHHEKGWQVRLTSQQIDRAVGVLVGQAAGDALGVPYEFGVRALTGEPRWSAAGSAASPRGRWSDDTETALCVAGRHDRRLPAASRTAST